MVPGALELLLGKNQLPLRGPFAVKLSFPLIPCRRRRRRSSSYCQGYFCSSCSMRSSLLTSPCRCALIALTSFNALIVLLGCCCCGCCGGDGGGGGDVIVYLASSSSLCLLSIAAACLSCSVVITRLRLGQSCF